MSRLLFVFFIGSIWVHSAVAATPSFDCRKAGTWTEKTLCADDELAALDREMALLYKRVADSQLDADAGKALRDEQRTFLKLRDGCRQQQSLPPQQCLYNAYSARINTLKELLGEPVAPTPADRSALAECYDRVAARPKVAPCLEQKLDEASIALDQASNDMQQQMRRLDAVGQSEPLAESSFNQSQDAFFQYRDTTCRWHSASYGSGTGSGDAYLACLVDRTRERTAEIRSLSEE